jgi:hypothetical protein
MAILSDLAEDKTLLSDLAETPISMSKPEEIVDFAAQNNFPLEEAENLLNVEKEKTILSEPVPIKDIKQYQQLDVENYLRENPKIATELQRKKENQLLTEYYNAQPPPQGRYQKRMFESIKRIAMKADNDNVYRKGALTAAKKYKIEQLREQGLITDERREYKNFWDELGRNIAGGSLNVASGLLGTLADVSQAAIWDAEKIEEAADKLHTISQKPEYAPAKEGGIRGFVAASIGQALPYMAASTTAAIITGNPYAAFMVGYSVEGDNAYREALENGATEEQAQMNRLVVGTINGAIEQIQINQIFKYANVQKQAVKQLSKVAQRNALQKIAQFGGKLTYNQLELAINEGLQEAFQETTSVAAVYRIDPTVLDNATRRILISGLGGSIVGLGLGSAGALQSKIAYNQANVESLAPETPAKPPVSPAEPRIAPETAPTTPEGITGQIAAEKAPEVKAPAKVIATTEQQKALEEFLGPEEKTPTKKISTLAQKTANKAIEENIKEEFGNLPEYTRMNMGEQVELANDLIETNPVSAYRIAMGREKPKGNLRSGSVFVALRSHAIRSGDAGMIYDLSNSKLTQQMSALGQEIKALDDRGYTNPVKAVLDIKKIREEALQKKAKNWKAERVTISKQIKQHIRRQSSKSETWEEFVRSIQC